MPSKESLERAKEIVEVWTYSMTVTGQEKLAAVIANALDQARDAALEEGIKIGQERCCGSNT